MKTIYTLILAFSLSGCYYNVTQYSNLHVAFLAGCNYATIDSVLTAEGDKQTLTATCTKAK
jgi:hypothetical protein